MGVLVGPDRGRGDHQSGRDRSSRRLYDNIGSQHLKTDSILNTNQPYDDYVVRTIRFDDLLPIIQMSGMKSVVMKVDIEASENFLCQTGSKIFDYLNIRFIMMEWMNIRLFKDRADLVVGFLRSRNYIVMDEHCKAILNNDYYNSWPCVVYWIKRDQITICV